MAQLMAPRISIVMPCYNAAAHLPVSTASVLAQDFADWELIIVDDGSTDESPTWLAGLEDPRIQVVRQANGGVSAARNRALAMARGDCVAFLDADDTWAPDFLRRMLTALDGDPAAVLAYCGWQNLGLPGGRGEPFVPPDYESSEKEALLFAGCRWPIHAALTRREALLEAGGFDSRLRNAEDYLLWLRVAVPARIIRVPAVLAYYHFHQGQQASARHADAALQFLAAQHLYLADHPGFARRLGRTRLRQLTWGALLQRGFERYWKNDLENARPIFRTVMRHGYGRPRDWLHMLPAWLPLRLHRALLEWWG